MSNNLARVSTVPMPNEADLGDAMLQITEAQRGFVIAFLETGGQEHQRAAWMAGFGNSMEAAAVAASRMMRNPNVLAAIREEADRRLKSGAILGASVLVEIASDTKHKDRFKAGVELLNRSGLIVEQTHRVIHEDHRSDAELERAVVNLAGRLGVDPKMLLGHAAAGAVAAVDAEFTEVVTVTNGDEGLEDLL
jgi:phage terminase small subunit